MIKKGRLKSMNTRSAEINRKTKETEIAMEFTVDGSGKAQIETGIGFFNHMLDSFTRHGFFDLKLSVKGDLYVDSHHTVEDTGIVLGQAIKSALGDKQGIRRYGSFLLPMDETLVLCAIDLSGRPYLSYDLGLTVDKVGYMDTELVKEFFYAISYSAGMNLHIKKISGENNHHIIEAAFKAFAKALDEATGIDPRIQGVLSTKGSIE
jgi:imidazoleglycerol-phosphate dehydratase